MKKKKKTRARSKEDKENQFQQIKDVGRRLFVANMSSGLRIRTLAKELDRGVSNLYNYVDSIRELWIAIKIEDLNFLKNKLEKVIKQHQGSLLELSEQILESYLDFARNEYDRFRILFFIPPPKSNKIGPLEKNYKPLYIIQMIQDLFQENLDPERKNERKIEILSYTVYSLAYGAAQIIHDLELTNHLREPLKERASISDIIEFKKSIKETLHLILNSYIND